MVKRVYLSPSNQTANTYSYGNTTEAVQCGRIAEYCRKALLRSSVEVMVSRRTSQRWRASFVPFRS